ncbi:unnamed protein product [Phaedon cochleariae]|uniref:H15 domain-containing protein n=1 Tax=Phaedon cochleariae TaxID=80249 RepID=A0A9P0GVN5_PHACE|nr:unnamed protein product [Phaedon cochleariae]
MKTPHPRFFDEVLDAIATLKDARGTPAKRVIEKVERNLSKKASFKNPAAQIQKALKFGVDKGLITESGGHFKLGLNNKEYKLYKDFKRMSGSGLSREHKRRGGKRKRRRSRRRGRRRSRKGSLDEAGDSDLEVSDSRSDSYIPEDRSRGRRRRRRRARRGRRRHADKTTSNESIKSDKSNEPSPKSSKDSMDKPEKEPKNIDRKNEGDPDGGANQFPEPTQDHGYYESRGCFRNRDNSGKCYDYDCPENCNCRRMT